MDRIETVEAVPIRAPRLRPMVGAGGRGPLVASDFGIVRVRTRDGVEGLGEISMNRGRTGADQCADVRDLFAPRLIGTDPLAIRSHVRTMDALVDGSEPAKAAVEMALFDIWGKVSGQPVHQLLGGRIRDEVPIRWSLAFGDPTDGVAEALEWIGRGVRTIKIKVGRPGTGLDPIMVETVRRGVGETINLVVDANGGYGSVGEAVSEIRILERARLQLVEQPLGRRRLHDLARVRSGIATPLSADESMRVWTDAYDVARLGAADSLSIYVAESGGMIATQKAAAIGEAAGMPVTIGSQCELGIGTAAMSHVAVTLPNLAYESDITGHLRYAVDIIEERLDYGAGAIRPPDGPGLGVTLAEDVLARWRLDR